MTALWRICTVGILGTLAMMGAIWIAATAHVPAPLPEMPPTLLIQAAASGVQARLSENAEPKTWIALAPLLIGRHSRDAQTIRYHWPAFTAKARFTGPQVALRLDDRQNRIRVTVDSGATLRLDLTKACAALLQLSGLGTGAHDISVQVISEAATESAFLGLWIPPDSQALPAPAASHRQLWVIGDSDTVGYGNTATTRECTGDQVFAATDSTQSYPALLGQDFGADATVTARSGMGLLRNYDGVDAGRALKQLYPLVLPDHPQAREADLSSPDVIVLAIGTNDFASPVTEGEAWPDAAALEQDFRTELAAFVAGLQHDHPDAALVLVVFPEADQAVRRSYRAIAATLAAQPHTAARLIELPDLARNGCHWHPSAADHRQIAALLAPVIADLRPAWRS